MYLHQNLVADEFGNEGSMFGFSRVVFAVLYDEQRNFVGAKKNSVKAEMILT